MTDFFENMEPKEEKKKSSAVAKKSKKKRKSPRNAKEQTPTPVSLSQV